MGQQLGYTSGDDYIDYAGAKLPLAPSINELIVLIVRVCKRSDPDD